MNIKSSERYKPLMAYLSASALAGLGTISFWLAALAPFSLVFAVHMALATGLWLFPYLRRDRTLLVFATISIIVLGPLGAIGSVFLARVSGAPTNDDPEFEAWYRTMHSGARIDQAAQISRQIGENRAIASQSSDIRSFPSVLEQKDLSDKQMMLGSLSQHYHPDYLPVLRSALTSEEAPVRVSAAAVYTKLRETYRKPIEASASHEGTASLASGVAAQVRTLAEAAHSGVLSDEEASGARQTALGLLLKIRPTSGLLDEVECLLCGMLLETARYDDIEARIGSRAAELTPAMRQILLRSRMRSHRYEELSSVAAPTPGRVVEFPLPQPAEQSRPLLTNPARGA
ncbi:MAG: hypothetical protein MEQ84_02565 [Mesorhizobium sp.]|nr:hypothetical protein [Mesorhizobium sp.]